MKGKKILYVNANISPYHPDDASVETNYVFYGNRDVNTLFHMMKDYIDESLSYKTGCCQLLSFVSNMLFHYYSKNSSHPISNAKDKKMPSAMVFYNKYIKWKDEGKIIPGRSEMEPVLSVDLTENYYWDNSVIDVGSVEPVELKNGKVIAFALTTYSHKPLTTIWNSLIADTGVKYVMCSDDFYNHSLIINTDKTHRFFKDYQDYGVAFTIKNVNNPCDILHAKWARGKSYPARSYKAGERFILRGMMESSFLIGLTNDSALINYLIGLFSIPKAYYLDVLNRNKRIYTGDNVMKCITEDEKIATQLRDNAWFGEQDHPMQKFKDSPLTPERIQKIMSPREDIPKDMLLDKIIEYVGERIKHMDSIHFPFPSMNVVISQMYITKVLTEYSDKDFNVVVTSDNKWDQYYVKPDIYKSRARKGESLILTGFDNKENEEEE